MKLVKAQGQILKNAVFTVVLLTFLMQLHLFVYGKQMVYLLLEQNCSKSVTNVPVSKLTTCIQAAALDTSTLPLETRYNTNPNIGYMLYTNPLETGC